jgi:hypothetical protein
MHDCQRFREDWIAGLTEDAGECELCRSFCADSQLILQAIEAATPPAPQLSTTYWDRFDGQVRTGLVRENTSRRYRFYLKWSTVAATSVITVGLTFAGIRTYGPFGEPAKTTLEIQFVDDHIKGLNPTVVDYLGQSELFLRSVTKIDPSYEEDFQDARSRAREELSEIDKQRLRAADFTPVQTALDEYENFLREIKNADSAGDLTDIQTRIRKSGLIANMNAYQPQLIFVAGGRQHL